MQRRELFSSFTNSFKEKKPAAVKVFPPYFGQKDDFYKICVECEGICAQFCKEQIIKIEEGVPLLDFAKGGCTYCDECALACPQGVLKVENKQKIDAGFEIDMLECLSWQQTMCFSCKDPCLDGAIEFLGMFRPSINTDRCTSCGFCVAPCPAEAIKIV